MEQQKMEQKIADYINAAYQWHATGNGSLIEGIGRTMEDLQEEILISFGLPYLAFQYSELLQLQGFSTKSIKARSSRLFKVLEKEAMQFLLSPIEKDVTVLKQAKENLDDAAEVLPIIGISTSAYNLFLYYEFYFRSVFNEEELLLNLKKVEAIDGDATTRIPYTYATLNGRQVKRLIYAGFPFIKEYRQFLKYNSTKQKWNRNLSATTEKASPGTKNKIELSRFFITYFAVSAQQNGAAIEILAEYQRSFFKLRIWCSTSIIWLLMAHAKYYSFSIPLLYGTRPKYLRNSDAHLWMKDLKGKNIEIENIIVGLDKAAGEERIDGPYYEIAYIHPSIHIPVVTRMMYEEGLPF